MKFTKEQLQVKYLYKYLSPIDSKSFDYAKENTFLKLGTTHYSKIACLECGNYFKDDKKSKKPKCPSCKNKLKIISTGKSYYEYGNAILIDQFKGYQVIRYIQIHRSWKKGQKAKSTAHECMQRWFSPEGKETILSQAIINNHGYYSRGIRFHSGELDIANECKSRTEIFGIVLPRRKGSKISKRNGYKYSIHGIRPEQFFRLILKNNKYETLLKTNTKLFRYFAKNHDSTYLDKYWKQVKICIRHEYHIDNVSDWIDLIRILGKLNKDVNSPKYILPHNLEKEHERWNKKLSNKNKKEKLKKLRENIKKDNIAYQKKIEDYKGIILEDKNLNLKITAIQSVQQLFNDSEILNHCAFNSDYHNKKNSILFRATVGNTLVETIEYNINTFKIVQSRGYDNKKTKYTDKILTLMNNLKLNFKNVA